MSEEELKATTHTLHVALRVICHLVGKNELTKERLSSALSTLIENSEPQMERLSVNEFQIYELHLQELKGIVESTS